MKNKKKKIVKTFLFAGMAVCLILIGQAYYQSVQHRLQQERLREMLTEASVQYPVQADSAQQEAAVSVLPGAEEADRENGQAENNPVMLAGYAGLYEENKDLAGWISIEGMKIDYPVMQTEDDTYYLHHDFYGEDSKYGCLYVKEQADLDAGTNFIIYGHNMKDGSMFGDLELYLKENFYKEHPVISFDTLYEERTYDI
ncbi:MAG: class B sortase, partial [Ruminococcus flavefaciens]|nr:class B sortase [Ruminococcus flavefaciens]